ncbi:TlpA family protein disulfide reductase [Lacibacter sp. H407]|uniref:TlpA family protein disulfide reductase n=1 Tax=Lacibacter sp. H407 TaxID=3133423 RepID=UPI0030BFEC13
MKQLILCLALLCPSLMFAQNKPLTIGDTLPPIVWNYLQAQAAPHLQQNTNRFIILDFWATWCTACIKETMPLDRLWRQHKNNLTIIMVAPEPKQQVKAFIDKRKTLKTLSLPFITDDRLLRQFFPYRYLPHQVWIAPGGKIEAITAGGLVNDSILQTWFAGNKPNLRFKSDPPPFDYTQPLFMNTNNHDSASLLYRSQWAGRLLGRGGSSGKQKLNGYVKYYFINRPPLSLYAAAYRFPPNHVIIENINPKSVVLYPTTTEEEKNNLVFTYELTVPENTTPEKITELMATDFNRYLGYYGRMEKRKLNCYALKSTAQTRSLLAQYPDANKIADRSLYWECMLKPLAYLIETLNSSYTEGTGMPIIIDETGIEGKVSLTLSYAALRNINQLKKELNNYAMELVQVEREIEVFVLSKK